MVLKRGKSFLMQHKSSFIDKLKKKQEVNIFSTFHLLKEMVGIVRHFIIWPNTELWTQWKAHFLVRGVPLEKWRRRCLWVYKERPKPNRQNLKSLQDLEDTKVACQSKIFKHRIKQNTYSFLLTPKHGALDPQTFPPPTPKQPSAFTCH